MAGFTDAMEKCRQSQDETTPLLPVTSRMAQNYECVAKSSSLHHHHRQHQCQQLTHQNFQTDMDTIRNYFAPVRESAPHARQFLQSFVEFVHDSYDLLYLCRSIFIQEVDRLTYIGWAILIIFHGIMSGVLHGTCKDHTDDKYCGRFDKNFVHALGGWAVIFFITINDKIATTPRKLRFTRHGIMRLMQAIFCSLLTSELIAIFNSRP